ncbi:hypothetical protein DXG01_011154, partial [Tephrocybe rancida]
YLHVCGYHQHLYTLDRQVDHAQRETLENLGAWLLRRSRHALTKWKVAESILQDCGKSETDLRAEWKDQVETQTKLLLCQSQNAGKDAVKELLQMHEATPMDEYAEAKADLESVHVRLQDLTTRIRNKQSVLGVTDHVRLRTLTNNPFLTAWMNALALKQRLRDRLRARKFEMERLEHLFRKQVNDQKINTHMASSVRSREPVIMKVARSYNTLCTTMEKLFADGKAPPGSICPKRLELKGIFDLDVDDTIWEDIGLEEGLPAAPPPWLANEGVHAGIKALLERDHCIEEEVHL